MDINETPTSNPMDNRQKMINNSFVKDQATDNILMQLWAKAK